MVFGGTAKYAPLKFQHLHLEAGFYWYETAVTAMATIGFLSLPDTKKTSLIADD